MRAFCPKCKEMVIVWTVLKMDEAEKLLTEDQPIEVVHPCPIVHGDFQWAVSKAEGMHREHKA
jgi:hypothetical protein